MYDYIYLHFIKRQTTIKTMTWRYKVHLANRCFPRLSSPRCGDNLLKIPGMFPCCLHFLANLCFVRPPVCTNWIIVRSLSSPRHNNAICVQRRSRLTPSSTSSEHFFRYYRNDRRDNCAKWNASVMCAVYLQKVDAISTLSVSFPRLLTCLCGRWCCRVSVSTFDYLRCEVYECMHILVSPLD